MSRQVCSPSSLQRRKMRVVNSELNQRLTAGQGNAALADLEWFNVLFQYPHRMGNAERFPILFVPGVRIVAVLTTQQTARQKNDKAQARTIDSATELG